MTPAMTWSLSSELKQKAHHIDREHDRMPFADRRKLPKPGFGTEAASTGEGYA
jgi:hypothetical protein